MSSDSHLPNPPAAAAAAVAAGYSLEEESDAPSNFQLETGKSEGGNSASSDAVAIARQPSFSIYSDEAAQAQPQKQHSQQNHAQKTQSFHQQQYPDVLAPAPLPGGLVNFYSYNNNSAGAAINFGNVGYRNTPSPAFGNRHLFVGNLPFNCQWQDLKDLFRAAGQILRADVSLGPDGRSRGFGTVLFSTADDAFKAVQMFNGYDYQGRVLKVHFDKFAVGTGNSQGPETLNGHQGPYYGYQYDRSPGIHPTPPLLAAGQHAHIQAQAAQHQEFLFQQQRNQVSQQQQHYEEESFSVPGTPIYEGTLAGFPSPGFGSPVPQQLPRQQSHDQRRSGMNADGVAVRPIGSEHHAYMQQQHQNTSLSPLIIPSGSKVSVPSSGGTFSPQMHGIGMTSPHQGLPMMTPSSERDTLSTLILWRFRNLTLFSAVPGFSFHPFPQTPPLLPHFLSPGLGAFSPPLAGTSTNFFGTNGPSGFRNTSSGGPHAEDSTPLQSPNLTNMQPGNYFPVIMAPQIISSYRHLQPESLHEQAQQLYESDSSNITENFGKNTAEAECVQPDMPVAEANTPTITTPDISETTTPDETILVSGPIRRASFQNVTKASSTLDVPIATSINRGASFDIPRPTLDLGGYIEESRNTSALSEEEGESPEAPPIFTSTGKNDKSAATQQSKKSPWNIPWLKK